MTFDITISIFLPIELGFIDISNYDFIKLKNNKNIQRKHLAVSIKQPITFYISHDL